MNERAGQAKSIFLEAIDKHAPEHWSAYLDKVCAGDAELRGDVEKLLHAQAEIGSFHAEPRLPVVPNVAQARREEPGTVIGSYKLLEQIGEGGFGVVFMAEQTQPVRRRVALKILKAGMDTRQVVVRFEAERQALAIMDHPNIAKVFDGGSTDTSSPAAAQQPGCFGGGRPYFVMELVKGIPITDFCDQNHLTPRKRLELFVAVCQAVQHAHHKGIIHRDLKPSNVLVTVHDTTPVPKVIDFGIAKALGHELTDKTLFTGFAQMIGTPLYMSPEQAGQSGLDIDTRSDIYSLGALLYELLTGTTPLDKERFKQAAYDEIRRIIREEEPPRPSTRLSESKDTLPSISAQRQTEPAKLSRLVRGELDWIVMKALDKDRNRRYDTANAFAMDVQRYLADDPVEACPPSALYRVRKFFKRHKVGLVMTAVVAASVVLAAGSLAWMVRAQTAREHEQAAREIEQTQREAETTRAVNALLDESLVLQKSSNVPRALAKVKEALAAVAAGVATPDLKERVETRLADLNFVANLQEIRTRRAVSVADDLNAYTRRDQRHLNYIQAFQTFGIDLDDPALDEAAQRIRKRTVAVELAEALDDWASLVYFDRPFAKRLRAIAQKADPDPWRNKVREALQQLAGPEPGAPGLRKENRSDAEYIRNALKKLLTGVTVADLPPSTVVILTSAVTAPSIHVVFTGEATDEYDLGVRLLLEAQQRHPDDFWLNWELAALLFRRNRRGDRDDALRFLHIAVALRPDDANARLLLGVRCLGSRDEQAVLAFQEVIRLQPKSATAHKGLGTALHSTGRVKEALAAFREADRLGANRSEFRAEFVAVLTKNGLVDEAFKWSRQADPPVEAKPDSVSVKRHSDKSGFAPDVAAAWEKAGARLGWALQDLELSLFLANYSSFVEDWWRSDRYFLYGYLERPALPCIRLVEWPRDGLAGLPAPATSFGLSIENLPPNPAQLNELASFEHLQVLSFAGRILTDADLKEVASLKQLRQLQLCATDVTQAGLQQLAGLSQLRTLSLCNMKVTDPVLKKLAGLRDLRMLDLRRTNVTDTGLKQLAELKQLETLVLRGTKVTNDGMRELAGFKQLQTLDLSGTAVTDAAMADLVALTKLTNLHLTRTKVSGAGMKDVALLEHLQVLAPGGTLTAMGLKELAGLKHLRSLDLTWTNVSHKELKELAGLPNLQVLRLSGRTTRVNDAVLKEVGGLRQLRTLRLYHCPTVTEHGLEPLAGLKQLQNLEVIAINISDASLKHLAGLTELQSLRLDCASTWDLLVTDDGLRELAGLTQLQRLNLTGARISEAGLKKHLVGLQELRMLSVWPQPTEQGKTELRKLIPKLQWFSE